MTTSPRAVTPLQAAQLPDFADAQRVGVFVNESPAMMLETAHTARLSALQLHGEETPELCASIRQQAPQLKLIKAFAIDDDFTGDILPDYETLCDFFLFDTRSAKRGGNGTVFDWRILQRLSVRRPFFLGGGVGPENAAQAIASCRGLPLYALDLNSRAETAPGLKSVAAVQRVIEVLSCKF